MSAPSNAQILFRIGGAEFARTGRLWRRTRHDPTELGAPVIARADATTCATFRGNDGNLHLAAANVLRIHWFDLNGDGIYETPAVLLEPGATNSGLRSRALGTSPWASHGTDTVVASAAAVGVDGASSAASTITPDASTNTNQHYVIQDITITSGEAIAAQVFLRANGYTGAVFRFGDSGSVNAVQMVLDLAAGTVLASSASGAAVLGGAAIEKWKSLTTGIVFYRCLLWGFVNGGVTACRNFVYCYDTGAHAQSQTAFTGNGTSGIIADCFHFERHGVVATAVPPGMPIITTSGTVTRAADSLYVPIGFGVLPNTIYVKHIERGSAVSSTGIPRIWTLGDQGSSNPPFWYLTNNAAYGTRYSDGVSGVIAAAASGIPNYGDVIETVASLAAGGVFSISQSVNGGAATSGGPTAGGIVLPPAWFAPKLILTPAGAPMAIISLIGASGVFALPDMQGVA